MKDTSGLSGRESRSAAVIADDDAGVHTGESVWTIQYEVESLFIRKEAMRECQNCRHDVQLLDMHC